VRKTIDFDSKFCLHEEMRCLFDCSHVTHLSLRAVCSVIDRVGGVGLQGEEMAALKGVMLLAGGGGHQGRGVRAAVQEWLKR
jgi:hypothetical protein